MKRSNQPFFWTLFGAGGMLSALIGAMLALITGVAGPLGAGASARALDHAHALAIARSVPGKMLLFVVVSLFLWHAAHRIYHSLHDVGIRSNRFSWFACYGTALLGTVTAIGALLAIA